VSILTIRKGGALPGRSEPVHREHLTRLHTDFQQPNPVPPERAKGFIRQGVGRQKRVQSCPKQHLGTIHVPNSRNNFLIHECAPDGSPRSLDPRKKPFLAVPVDKRVRAEVIEYLGDAHGAHDFAQRRSTQVGDNISGEDSNANLSDGVRREGVGLNADDVVFAHSKPSASRCPDRREGILMSAHHRATTPCLAHPSTRSRRGVIQLHRPREIPGTIDAEVDVQRIARVELEKQMLTDSV
jgi:hypothetical protein